MLHQATVLKKFDIHATDGDIGEIHDYFFDDESWAIRYLVVDTLKWLPGRKVLLSPIDFDNVDVPNEQVNVSLTKEKIKNSPDIHAHEPISRKQEVEISHYYGWPYYWSGAHVWGNHTSPSDLKLTEQQPESVPLEEAQADQAHLRSVKEIAGTFSGYRIHAKNGEIGHVSDIILDDETWMIRYFIVDTKNWLPGKLVLISTDWITNVNWSSKSVTVDLEKESIENAPEYDPSETLSREYEEKLYENYAKPKYWNQM